MVHPSCVSSSLFLTFVVFPPLSPPARVTPLHGGSSAAIVASLEHEQEQANTLSALYSTTSYICTPAHPRPDEAMETPAQEAPATAAGSGGSSEPTNRQQPQDHHAAEVDQQPDKKKMNIEDAAGASSLVSSLFSSSSSSSSSVSISAARCPADWLQQIHSFLSLQELCAAARTCRHWHASAVSTAVSHRSFASPSLSAMRVAELLASRSPLLSHLSTLRAAPLKSHCPSVLQLNRLPHVRTLDLTLDFGLTMTELLPSSQLTALHLSFAAKPFQSLINQLSSALAAHCPHLLQLHLDMPAHLGSDQLDFHSFLLCPSLTDLHAGRFTCFADTALALAALRLLPLKKLRVQSIWWTNERLQQLVSGDGNASRIQLEEIVFDQREFDLAADLRALLPFASTLTSLPMSLVSDCFPLLPQFRQLRTCRLYSWDPIAFSTLLSHLTAEPAAGCWDRLTSLNCDTFDFSVADLAQLVALAPQLRTLGLTGCEYVSLLPLAAAPSLRELSFASHDREFPSLDHIRQLTQCEQIDSLRLDYISDDANTPTAAELDVLTHLPSLAPSLWIGRRGVVRFDRRGGVVKVPLNCGEEEAEAQEKEQGKRGR